jgi:hypothetical protein
MVNTWYDMLRNEMEARDDPGPVIKYTPNESAFNGVFFLGFGGPEGPNLTAWTDSRVYFQICYHGAKRLGSALRNPPG